MRGTKIRKLKLDHVGHMKWILGAYLKFAI